MLGSLHAGPEENAKALAAMEATFYHVICTCIWSMFYGKSIGTHMKFNIAPESYLPKRKVISQPSFFRGYVKLRGCKYTIHGRKKGTENVVNILSTHLGAFFFVFLSSDSSAFTFAVLAALALAFFSFFSSDSSAFTLAALAFGVFASALAFAFGFAFAFAFLGFCEGKTN